MYSAEVATATPLLRKVSRHAPLTDRHQLFSKDASAKNVEVRSLAMPRKQLSPISRVDPRASPRMPFGVIESIPLSTSCSIAQSSPDRHVLPPTSHAEHYPDEVAHERRLGDLGVATKTDSGPPPARSTTDRHLRGHARRSIYAKGIEVFYVG